MSVFGYRSTSFQFISPTKPINRKPTNYKLKTENRKPITENLIHTCNALLVSCIDFRIQSAVEDWASQNLGPKNYDRVALAGGVKDFPAVMRQIDISAKLHSIKKVVLTNHEDCGAYLPAEKRSTSRERIVHGVGERQAKAGGESGTEDTHRQDLLSAASAVKSKYPDLQVETHFVRLNGQFNQIS